VVPDLVPEADLDNANGLIMFAQRIAEVAFVGLAGLLVALVGAAPAFYIDGATFLLSALIVKGLPQLDPGAGSESAYWARVGEGLRHLVENPPVRRTVLTLAAAAMFGSVEAVLGVVLAVTVLGVGSAGFGVMEAAIALGAVLGTLVIPRLIQRTSRERLFIYGLLAFGLLEASIGLAPHYTWVLIVYLLSGALNMIFIVPARSILQLNTPPALRTRTFSAFGAVMNAAVLFGTIVGGALEGPLGAQMVFVIAGLGVSGVVVVTLVRDRLALVQSPLVSASTLSNESGMD
jgi:predicted MFS family arabinose efflux permease